MPSGPKAKVKLVFTHINPDTPTWPNIGYDYEGSKKEIIKTLSKACPDIEFIPASAANAQEGKKPSHTAREKRVFLCVNRFRECRWLCEV